MIAGVDVPTWADLVVEANFALTLFIGVGLVLVWREVFPAAVRPTRRRGRPRGGPEDHT